MMRILAFDSSALVAGVALLDGDQILAEYNLNYKKTHSQTLLPMLDEICGMLELDLNSIDALAVAAGPGSFTGLRIGSATVKGLGLALDKPVIPVPTMQAMAYDAYGYPGLICPIMDARRGQVFTGLYRFDGTELLTVIDQTVLDMGELLDTIAALPCEAGGREAKRVLFLGDGISLHSERIMEDGRMACEIAPPHRNRQRAAAVAALGLRLYAEGIFESAAEHAPEYLRVSQAEREKAEREKAARKKEKREEAGQQDPETAS